VVIGIAIDLAVTLGALLSRARDQLQTLDPEDRVETRSSRPDRSSEAFAGWHHAPTTSSTMLGQRAAFASSGVNRLRWSTQGKAAVEPVPSSKLSGHRNELAWTHRTASGMGTRRRSGAAHQNKRTARGNSRAPRRSQEHAQPLSLPGIAL